MEISHESGTSLIEILIAISILSFGLLGIAEMQTSAIANISLAYQYSQAALLAQSIAENIRANPAAAAAGLYQVSPDSLPTSSGKNCLEHSCSPTELANWNIATWTAMLAGRSNARREQTPSIASLGLASGKLGIRCQKPCDDHAIQIITIYWDARRNGATGTGCNSESSSDLICFHLAHAL